MRWSGQQLDSESTDALPGLARLSNLVRSVTTPEFAGVRFHEVLAKSALNRVPGESAMPFGWTINPYRGCSHACVYCLSGETQVLMADGRQKPLWAVRVGDRVVGTEQRGRYRRYIATDVLAHWSTRKPAFRIVLEDGTTLVASGEHRFLTERGWKHVSAGDAGQRPHLTLNNSLVGFGTSGLDERESAGLHYEEFRRGYLAGMIRGDGHLATHDYVRRSGRTGRITQFRLALADSEALMRTRTFLEIEGVTTGLFEFSGASATRRRMDGIRAASKASYDRITALIELPGAPSRAWHRGFLSGIFDAEGSHSRGILRISNSDAILLETTREALDVMGIAHATDGPNAIGVSSVRVLGGLPARQKFFRLVEPAITRKLSVVGSAVKSNARLRVVSIEETGFDEDMFDITTGTADFIANGVISHNCFARNTHTYLDLDAGKDFDSEVIVKVNVAEVLAKELARPSWGHEAVALGTNTDPYQRAEGRYRLMPGIIAALAESGTPLSILTKGTLLRRDLPLIVEAAGVVPVHLAMSVAVYDDELQQSIEPGTPSTRARLDTVRAAREHGLHCSVFLMPVLPYLTDSVEHLERAITQASEAGASSLTYTALHLRPGAREWYFAWLEREHPELVQRYRDLYRGGSYAPKAYREWLAARMRPLLRSRGLGTRPSAELRAAVTGGGLLAAELPARQPTLF